MYRFGVYRFDAATGELTSGEKTERLAPQIGRVLELLLEHAGAIVPREEFHRRLWPDATVEFDQGLNFCIRQLRIALGDDAGAPTYIETLPRRGYRFLAAATRDESVTTEPPVTARQQRRPAVRFETLGATIIVVLIALAGAAAYASAAKRPILAIVPFDADTSAPEQVRYRDRMMEALIQRTTERAARELVVVGSSYTQRFGSRTPIDTIHAGVGAGYAVSGAVHRSGTGFDVFAQLVRASDRGHLWVIRLADSTSADFGAIGAQIADSVAAIVTNPTAPRKPRGFEQRARLER